MTNLTSIPADLLRVCFASEHYAGLLTQKETHDNALRFVAQVVSVTQDAGLIGQIAKTAFSDDYKGNTMEEIPGMVEDAIAKGFHETDEKEKEEEQKAQAQLLFDLVISKGCELFHDAIQRPFMLYREAGRSRVYLLSSTASKHLLRRMFYKEYGRVMGQQPFKQACDLLEATALFDYPELPVYLRIAPFEGNVVINLADDEGNVVIINKDGYQVTNDSPVMFMKSSVMSALPLPVESDFNALQEFKHLLGLAPQTYVRVLAFLINCLKADGPYLCLLTEGEQGSGKSMLTEFCKAIIDPSQAPKIRMPDNERDLMIQAKDTALPLFDNVSSIKPQMSDALCSLATGGGFSTRKLYTDDEQMIFHETRPFICNGISAYATRADLLERSLPLKLQTMPKKQRKGEREIRERFIALRPAMLHQLYMIVSCALRNFDLVEPPTTVRMADAAHWLVAAEPQTGLPEGTLLLALEESQADIILESLLSDSLAVALCQVAERGGFSGTMGDLYVRIVDDKNFKVDRYFPPTAAHMSKKLLRLIPGLRLAGVTVEIGPKVRTGKMVKVSLTDPGSGMSYVRPGKTETPEGGIEV